MKKKLIALCMAAVMCLGALTGCGAEKETEGEVIKWAISENN